MVLPTLRKKARSTYDESSAAETDHKLAFKSSIALRNPSDSNLVGEPIPLPLLLVTFESRRETNRSGFCGAVHAPEFNSRVMEEAPELIREGATSPELQIDQLKKRG
jgi:hypothetical protein